MVKPEMFQSPGANERGATMVEYALMAALIAVVSIASVAQAGVESRKAFNTVAKNIQEAGASNPPLPGGGGPSGPPGGAPPPPPPPPAVPPN